MNKFVEWNWVSVRASICGHKTKRKGEFTVFGETIKMSMPLKDGKPEYCLDCIAKMSIRCAWCGGVVTIGDPVTLYSPGEKYEIPDYAVAYKDDPKILVGCLRWKCANTGGDRTGFWLPSETKHGTGEVFRVPSPIEMTLNGNCPVYVNDVTDIKEAVDNQRTM